MKLLWCKACGDVFSLQRHVKWCSCKKTAGVYRDNVNAEYFGENAVPVGFHNRLFLNAVAQQPEEGMGKNFEAFIIPKKCPTLKRVNVIS